MNDEDWQKFFEAPEIRDYVAILEEVEKENREYNDDLRARAKTREELIVSLECTVLEIHGYQGLTSVHSEMRMGESSPYYNTGHTYRTEIKVQSDTSVEKLEFKGWPPLEAGDLLRAYIIRGELKYEKTFRNDFNHNLLSHWIERDYQQVEHPIKIEKLRDGKVVATYHNS